MEDTNVPGQALPLTETTNEGAPTTNGDEEKPRATRQPRQRGPPEDGIPSKNKVMVANLPYDLSEEKVSHSQLLSSLPNPIDTFNIAQGTLLCLQPNRRQDRSSPYRSLHGEETPGP